MLLAHQDVALRVASFTLDDRRLFWARARLYPDRLELTGWSLWGRYHTSIPLVRIEEVSVTEEGLRLDCTDGSSLCVRMTAPEQWASAIALHRDMQEGSD